MRRFVVLGHTQRPQAPLPLNDSAGAGGRWDLLARCVTNALLVSHDCRRDTQVFLVLAAGPEPRTVRVDGNAIQRLNPDERSTVALLSRALEATDIGRHESSVLPGIHTSRRGLGELLAELAPQAPVWLLDEAASVELETWRPAGDGATFVLSDHREPTPEERSVLRRHTGGALRLGPVPLQADQCITLVHNRLDRLKASPTARPAPAAARIP